jgi:DNA-binding XRE family transcriptional regulator
LKSQRGVRPLKEKLFFLSATMHLYRCGWERVHMAETNRLRVIRAEKRMTQLSLATATGVHPTRVWKIENGYAEPSPRERHAIASALGSSERDIWPNDAITAK